MDEMCHQSKNRGFSITAIGWDTEFIEQKGMDTRVLSHKESKKILK